MPERLTKEYLDRIESHCGKTSLGLLAEIWRLRGIIVAADDEDTSHDYDGCQTEGWKRLGAEARLIREEADRG